MRCHAPARFSQYVRKVVVIYHNVSDLSIIRGRQDKCGIQVIVEACALLMQLLAIVSKPQLARAVKMSMAHFYKLDVSTEPVQRTTRQAPAQREVDATFRTPLPAPFHQPGYDVRDCRGACHDVNPSSREAAKQRASDRDRMIGPFSESPTRRSPIEDL
jgi:hypothetical protein